MTALYRGFSTAAAYAKRGRSFRTVDFETVKYDLLNEIYTIPGERPMMPNFGTRIPLLAFEPMDQETLGIVEDDLTRVINDEPRVKLVEIAVMALPDNNAIVALVDLIFLELNTKETLKLDFPVGS